MIYNFRHIKTLIIILSTLFFVSSISSASVIAVLSGATTDSQKVCQLSFVDLDEKNVIDKFDFPHLASAPIGLFEFGPNIITLALQEVIMTKQRNTVVSLYSPMTGEFEKSTIFPGHHIVEDINIKHGLLWLLNDDNEYIKLNLNHPKMTMQDVTNKENFLKSKFKDNKLYYWQNNRFYSFEGVEDLDLDKLPIDASSENFYFERKIQQVEDIFDNGKKLALGFYDEDRNRILAILSKQDSSVLLETQFPEYSSMIGWLDDNRLLFLEIEMKFNNQYELEQVKVVLVEWNSETQELVSKNDFFLDPSKYEGVIETLISRDKRYVIIGCTHVGGRKYTTPGLLVIYDRVTNQPAILEFEAGTVSDIIELSEATIHVLKQKRR